MGVKDVVDGEEDRVKVEAVEGPQNVLRIVAGYADVLHQPLLLSLQDRSDRSLLTERRCKFVGVIQSVELIEIKVVGLKALQAASEFLSRRLLRPLSRLTRQE